MNQQQEELVVVGEKKKDNTSTIAAIIIFIWMLLGLLAFVTSIVCFAYDGSFMQNWVGFLTAVVLGPFYWIFFTYSDGYCKSGGKQQLQKKLKQVKQFTKKSFGKKGKKKA